MLGLQKAASDMSIPSIKMAERIEVTDARLRAPIGPRITRIASEPPRIELSIDRSLTLKSLCLQILGRAQPRALSLIQHTNPPRIGRTNNCDKQAKHDNAELALMSLRRLSVLSMLESDPTKSRTFLVDDASTDPVTVTVAIRDIGTCELLIPLERYDPFKILAVIDIRDAK